MAAGPSTDVSGWLEEQLAQARPRSAALDGADLNRGADGRRSRRCGGSPRRAGLGEAKPGSGRCLDVACGGALISIRLISATAGRDTGRDDRA